jgi:hypothetical protein
MSHLQAKPTVLVDQLEGFAGDGSRDRASPTREK